MDTNKLFKAIQIVVKEEVKKQTSIIKEEVRKEILAELKKSNVQKPIIEKKIDNPFDKALAMLEEDREVEQKQYSKNPTLNQILNETAVRPNFSRTDGEINLWRLYNLFTGANKSSYIDRLLDRGVNASSLLQAFC